MHEIELIRRDILERLTIPRSDWAWTYLSLGNLTEAIRSGVLENDIVAWAASLALSGDCRRALLTIEAYIVATCQTVAELFRENNEGDPNTITLVSAQQMHNFAIAKWLASRKWGEESGQEKTKASLNESIPFSSPVCDLDNEASDKSRDAHAPSEYQNVIAVVTQLVSWQDLHLWYIIALTLLNDSGEEQTYVAPVDNAWFRYFFAFPSAEYDKSGVASSTFSAVNVPEQITQQRTLEFLVSQCSEWETLFVTALTAFYMQHYHTSITFATRFLNMLSQNEKPKGESSGLAAPILNEGFYHTSMLAVRCQASLETGQRTEAAKDMLALMQVKVQSRGTPSEYVSMFGCALALYGMPLRDVLGSFHRFLCPNADADAVAPFPARVHILSVAFYVHALTLLQLGQIDQSVIIANVALNFAPPNPLKEALKEVVLRACVAQENSTTILGMKIIVPHQLVYLSLCSCFFGGLTPLGVRAKRNTPSFRLLYPTKISLYASTRQMLPFYMNRAYCLFHHHCYNKAWEDICCAVELADEIVGSTEFAFTPCFPLHVYYYACKIGFATFENILQKDVQRCLLGGDSPLESNPLALCGTDALFTKSDRSKSSGFTTDTSESMGSYLDSRVCVQIIDFCRHCVRQINAHYPYSMLGDVVAAQVAVMSHESNSVPRAILLSRRYPKIILAQTTWTLALFFDNRISNAMDASQKNFQDFPHSDEVVATQKWMGLKGIKYTLYYRTLLPVEYGPGTSNRCFTKRFLVCIVLIVINWVVYVFMLVLNLKTYKPNDDIGKVVEVLRIPSTWMFLLPPVFLVYGLIMALTSKNLVQSLLEELHFCDSSLNRFIFVMRSVVMINTANVLQIIFSGKWKLPNNSLLTSLLFIVLITLTMPFTSRVWFLPSIDEPNVGLLQWVSILLLDIAFYIVLIIPHVILAVLEPLMAVVFFLVVPSTQLGIDGDTTSIRRRLLYHERNRYALPSYDGKSGGALFIHIRLMKLLYSGTHVKLVSKNLEKSQIESEGYRAFPLLDETLMTNIPLGHSWINFEVLHSFLLNNPNGNRAVAGDALNAQSNLSGENSSKPSGFALQGSLVSGSAECAITPSSQSLKNSSKPLFLSQKDFDFTSVVDLPMGRMINRIFCMQMAAHTGSSVDSDALQTFSSWSHKDGLLDRCADSENDTLKDPILRHLESFVGDKTDRPPHSNATGAQRRLLNVLAGIRNCSLSRFLHSVRGKLFRRSPSQSRENSALGFVDTHIKEGNNDDEQLRPFREKDFSPRSMEATAMKKHTSSNRLRSSATRFMLQNCEIVSSDSDQEVEYIPLQRAAKPTILNASASVANTVMDESHDDGSLSRVRDTSRDVSYPNSLQPQANSGENASGQTVSSETALLTSAQLLEQDPISF